MQKRSDTEEDTKDPSNISWGENDGHKQYSSLRCVIALAQHTASVECRTMFEVIHAIVCHAMFCRHMISSNPMCYLRVPSLAQVCNFYGTSHCCPVPPQNNFLLLVNSSRGGILFRSQWWKLFSTEILVY